jgi:hypothetical protein
MFPNFDDETPNQDDMQITVALNDTFLPDNAPAGAIGVRQGVERAGNPLIVTSEGGEKNGPGGLLRDALDALDGPDIAARQVDDLRAIGALNPELAANPNVTYSGYVIEQRIPFGFIPEFNSQNIMKYTHFWNDADTADGPGGANKSWIAWGQQSTVGCAEDEEPRGLFHAGTWAALEFSTDSLSNEPGPSISLRKAKDFGQLDIPPVTQELVIPVRNIGTTNALNISAINVSGTDAARFTVTSFPSTLAPKMVGDIVVTFDSQGITGPYEATLEVVNDDADAEDQTRSLTLSLSVIDPAGPSAHLKLDEAEGDLADASGNGRGGVVNATAGSVSLNQDPLAGGKAVQVSGNGTIELEGKPFGALESFSVFMWFQAANQADQGTLVSRGIGGSPIFAILKSGSNAALFVNDGPVLTTTGDLIQAGTAHHMGFVYDATGAATIYLDGVEAGVLDEAPVLDDIPADPFWLGSFASALGFDGIIDDFQFYHRVLSAEDVQTLKDNPGEALRGVTPGGPVEALTIVEEGLGADTPAIVVLDGSFGEDALTFSDRTHEHNSAEFDDNGVLTTGGGTAVALPSYLVGKNYIRFANDARAQGDYSAVVTAATPTYWYLLLDNRIDGPAGSTDSPNTEDPVLGGSFQWVIDGGWERVNTGISPNDQADYVGIDESGDNGLNQFYSIWTLAEPTNSATVLNNGAGGSNMISLVAGTGAPVSLGGELEGLIGYWPLDGSAADASGQGADGTVIRLDGVWVEDAGRSAYQSGNGSYIELGALPLISADTDFTWSFWVNPDETSNNNIVFGNRWAPDGTDFAPREFIKVTPTTFEWHVDGAGQNVPGADPLFVVGEWSHNLVVKSGTTLTYYRNRAEIATSEIVSAPANAQPLYLGGQNGEENFSGMFDEVAIFNRALSADEVTAVYTRGLSGISLKPSSAGAGDPGGPLPAITKVGIQASGAFGINLPDGLTADIEYSTDLITWETIATGITGDVEETDATRRAATAGFYRAKR